MSNITQFNTEYDAIWDKYHNEAAQVQAAFREEYAQLRAAGHGGPRHPEYREARRREIAALDAVHATAMQATNDLKTRLGLD